MGDLSLFEINEAFAAVAVASTEDLGVSPEIVNPNGGGQGDAVILRAA